MEYTKIYGVPLKRVKLHLYLSVLYLLPVLFKVANALLRGLSLTAPLDTLEELLLTDFVGKSSDTFLYYLPPAYSLLRYGEPVFITDSGVFTLCYRVVQSFVFYPFMVAFGEYFPLYYVFTFSLVFANGLAALLWEINPNRLRLNLLVGSLIFPTAFYYLPFLMLEAPTASALLLYTYFTFRYVRRRSDTNLVLALPFLMFAVFLRPEMALLSAPLLFFAFRSAKKYLPLVLLSVLTPLSLNVRQTLKCGDQSNFYLWAYAQRVERERGKPYGDVLDFINDLGEDFKVCLKKKGVPDPSSVGFGSPELNSYFQMFQLNNREYSACFRELFLKDLEPRDVISLLRQIPVNFASLIFPSLSSSRFFERAGALSLPFKVFYVVYGLLTVFFLLCAWSCGKREISPFLVGYILLCFLYALYNPFGNFDALRFKMYLLPFEVLFAGFTFREFLRPLQS